MSGMLLPNRDGSSSPSFNLSTLNEGDSKELGLDDTELGILADHKQGEGHGMRHRNTSSSSGFHVDGDGNRISRALSKLMEKHLAPVNDLSVEQDADTATLLSSSSSRALSTQDQHHLHPHSHAHHMTPLEKKLMFSYESLDYDTVTNDLFHRDRPRSKESITSEWRVRWLLFGLIGFFTGTLAMALSYCTHHLVEWKYHLIHHRVVDGEFFEPLFIYVGVSVMYASVAAFLVAFVEPVAGGSGIPEIKGYLNGTNYLRFLKLKTLVCKAVGVMFSVSSGLIIGKEGPLVHSGAIMGANLSNMTGIHKWGCWSASTRKWLNRFRNDRDKRDFVSAGASAGVAAAFGAPVGGILFSLEEACSFWDTRMTWLVFLSAMMGTFTYNVFTMYIMGEENFEGMVTFGPKKSYSSYQLWETPFFVLIGVIGGLSGALFNHINEQICHFRRDHMIGKKYARFIEALCMAALTAFVAFLLPTIFGECNPIPEADLELQAEIGEGFYHSFRCGGEHEFNTMASILFAPSEMSIRGFFHNTAEYNVWALFVYFLLIFVLSVITYGIAVPSGLFVPGILMGCSYGRWMGEILRIWFPSADINPGTYAVIGAAASLGGVSRATVSLCVIMLETTQDMEFIMPIMLVIIVSKWVGDYFNISIYDIHVELRCIPFVEYTPSGNLYGLQAAAIMHQPVVQLKVTNTVEELVEVLKSCTHNGFPVVTDESPHRLIGMILRSQIIVLINKRAFGTPDIATGNVNYDDFATSLSSKHRVLAPVDDDDLKQQLVLSPFMNPVPISVQMHCPLSRVFGLFRSLGTRHLCVVDHNNQVQGMITRKEIMSSFDQDLF